MPNHNFRELIIWKDALMLAKEIMQLTATFPNKENFGLISQINRAAVSIASNIAEGSAYQSNKKFYLSCSISLGSLYELETQLLLSKEIGYVTEEKTNLLIDTIVILEKRIKSFMNTLNK
jgi:four helix bundle protein